MISSAPNALHGNIAIEAAQGGKHVICEKPLTGSFGSAKDQGLMRAIRKREEAQASLEQSHGGSHAAATRRRETAGGGALPALGAHPIAAALHLKAYERELLCGKPIRAESLTADLPSGPRRPFRELLMEVREAPVQIFARQDGY